MDSGLELLNDLRTGRSTVSIITTYSVDFDFYETVVLRRLNAAGCQHHLLLVDANRYAEALADPDRRPRLAGISYTLLPIVRRGAFHPKLVILADKKSSRVYVGSHNLTFAGFGGNAEITNAIGGARSFDQTDILASALTAIASWVQASPASVASEIVQIARDFIEAGGKKQRAGAGTHLLFSGHDLPPLWEQLRPYLPAKVRRVVLAGPFFDHRMEFVRRALADLKASRFVVGVDPAYAQLDAREARKLKARFVDARPVLDQLGFSQNASLHAKLLLIEAEKGWLLVSGSANPSAAAWLSPDTNAEAVLVRSNLTGDELTQLGLLDFFDAPEITTEQWAEIESHAAEVDEGWQPHRRSGLVAFEDGGRLSLHGLSELPIGVRIFLENDKSHEATIERYEDGVALVSGGALDLSTCTLVETLGCDAGFAIVNHVGPLSRDMLRSNARAELQAALSAVTSDPAHIEEVFRIVERAIDDLDNVNVISATRTAPFVGATDPAEDEAPVGSRAIKLDDVRRRHARPRSYAAGDVAVVIDLLIRRISEGLPLVAADAAPREVEESELDPVERESSRAIAPVDGDALVKACHRKVRRLLRRMQTRLEQTMESGTGATRTTVQLAAVLGVLRWLRRIERQVPWLPFDASLVPEEAGDELLWSAARSIGLIRPSLVDLVNQEVPDSCEEVALSLGLLGWLGREAGIDVRALAQYPEEEDLPWFHWTAVLLMLLQHVVLDEASVKVLHEAVGDGRGADRFTWLEIHLRMARAAARAASSPDTAPVLKRAARRGDIVRFKMRNGRSGIGFVVDVDETKVRLLDAENDDGRPVMREFVAPLDVNAVA